MRNPFRLVLLGTAPTIFLLTACAPPSSADGLQEEADTIVEVSDEDLKAARLLSLTNSGALDTISDPYERAVTCALSIETLVEQLREKNIMTVEQLRTTQAAATLYRRQAAENGKSLNDVSQEIERLRLETHDLDFQTRAAISCLKDLT